MISRILLFIRISSSRLLSVWFVMRVHWIMRVSCGGTIMVPMVGGSACFGGSWVFSVGSVRSVFQSWSSFIWLVVVLCCIISVSARKVAICWIFSFGISRVAAIWSMLCHWLSLRRFNKFSSLADKRCLPSVC